MNKSEMKALRYTFNQGFMKYSSTEQVNQLILYTYCVLKPTLASVDCKMNVQLSAIADSYQYLIIYIAYQSYIYSSLTLFFTYIFFRLGYV